MNTYNHHALFTCAELSARQRHMFAALLLLLISRLVTTTDAATVTLDFNSLPSHQGWTYEPSGPLEASIFSVDGTAPWFNIVTP